jgi:small ligand-binding sensory domain FIST
MFSCVGRGLGLFGEPNHDSGLVRSLLGPVAVGGFFCNGEIGPVGQRTYVHTYTSVIALISPGR